MLVAPDHAEDQVSLRRSLGDRFQRVVHAAELTHDRVKSVIQGHPHRDRRVDRGLLRLGPQSLLADLLVGGHSGGGHARDHGSQRPPLPVRPGACLHTEPGGQANPGQADDRGQVDPRAGVESACGAGEITPRWYSRTTPISGLRFGDQARRGGRSQPAGFSPMRRYSEPQGPGCRIRVKWLWK